MPANQHISPAVAQNSVNECERLKKVNAELVETLAKIDRMLVGSLPVTNEVKQIVRAALARAKEQP